MCTHCNHPDETPFVPGYAMCFGLMGVLSLQGFIYFTRFPHDRMWTKMLVAAILLLESLITAFAFHGFWTSVINHEFSSVVAQGSGFKHLTPAPIWSFVALSPLTGTVSTLTHGFFCWRIWVVRQSLVIPGIIMAVSLLQCAMVTYGGVVYGLIPDVDINHPMPFYIPIWLAGSLFCDTMITVYMTEFFLRSKSEFQSTQSLSRKLIKLTIETGLVTTTAAVVELVLAIAYRVTLYHLAMFYIISKLYANCLLATLNARLILRNPKDGRKPVAVWDSSPSVIPSTAHSHLGQTTSHGAPQSTVIQIHTMVETELELSPLDSCKHTLHDDTERA